MNKEFLMTGEKRNKAVSHQIQTKGTCATLNEEILIALPEKEDSRTQF